MSRPFNWEEYILEPVPHFVRVWAIIEDALARPEADRDVADYFARMSKGIVEGVEPRGTWNPSAALPAPRVRLRA